MPTHKETLKALNPKMLLSFEDDTNITTAYVNNVDGIFVDEMPYDNFAFVKKFRINGNILDKTLTTKSIIDNEAFADTYSIGIGKNSNLYSDVYYNIELDETVYRPRTDNNTLSFQIKIPDKTATTGIIEGDKEYYLDKTILVINLDDDDRILGHLNPQTNKFAAQLQLSDLYNLSSTTAGTMNIAFVLVDSDYGVQIKEHSGQPDTSHLLLDENPLDTRPVEVDFTKNSVWSYILYTNSSHSNYPVGQFAVSKLRAINKFTMTFDPSIAPGDINYGDIQLANRYTEYEEDKFIINIIGAKIRYDTNLFELVYNDGSFRNLNHSDVIIFYGTMNVMLPITIIGTSFGPKLDLLKFGDLTVKIGFTAAGSVISFFLGVSFLFSYTILNDNSDANHFVFKNEMRSNNTRYAILWVNGEKKSEIAILAGFSMLLENYEMRIGTIGRYIYYDGTFTNNFANVDDYELAYINVARVFLNLIPTAVALDNIAIFDKTLTDTEIKKVFLSGLTNEKILKNMGIQRYYTCEDLKYYYKYLDSNDITRTGWYFEIPDSIHYKMPDIEYNSTYTLYYSGFLKPEDETHFKIKKSLYSAKDSILRSRSNFLNYDTTFTLLFWFKTTQTDRGILISSVTRDYPFGGTYLEIDNGFITINIGDTQQVTSIRYNDNDFHRIVIQSNTTVIKVFIGNEVFEFNKSAINNYNNAYFTGLFFTNDLIGNFGLECNISEIQYFNTYIDQYYLDVLQTNTLLFSASGHVYFNNLPSQSTVRIYNHNTGELLSQSKSDVDGAFLYEDQYIRSIDVVVISDTTKMAFYQIYSGIILNSK